MWQPKQPASDVVATRSLRRSDFGHQRFSGMRGASCNAWALTGLES